MTGILLFAVIWIWFLIVRSIVKRVDSKLPERWWRVWVKNMVFVFLLISPLMDELLGKQKFDSLCQEKAETIKMDRESLRGTTVYYYSAKPYVVIRGQVTNRDLIYDFWIPIWQRSVQYVNSLGKEVISYKELYADGGWISRVINFNGFHGPYTFDGVCRPKENIQDVFKSLQIKAMDYSRN